MLTLILMLSMTSLPAVMEERPPVTGQVTFLYYEDLPAAERFYREVLGLSTSFELDWVKIFRLSSGSSVGLVNATKGSLRPAAVNEEKSARFVLDLEIGLKQIEAAIAKLGENMSVRRFVRFQLGESG